MPPLCTICEHKRIRFIDSLVVDGRSLLSVSKHVGVSYHALRRHVGNGHVSRPDPSRVLPPPPTTPTPAARMVYVFSDDEDALHDSVAAEWAEVVARHTGLTSEAVLRCYTTPVSHDFDTCASCIAVDEAEALLSAMEAWRERVTPPAEKGRWEAA